MLYKSSGLQKISNLVDIAYSALSTPHILLASYMKQDACFKLQKREFFYKAS